MENKIYVKRIPFTRELESDTKKILPDPSRCGIWHITCVSPKEGIWVIATAHQHVELTTCPVEWDTFEAFREVEKPKTIPTPNPCLDLGWGMILVPRELLSGPESGIW